ncbi:MAG: Ig-like domain-containing protein [Bacteroidaceae bacterium]|nr:Ig-like domain-containing protein [Bacteroidaceae bacterium]
MKRFTILFFLCVMSIPLLHAQKQVSGTVYSSQLPDYAEVVLTGDTKIVVNMDRMIRYIKGDYNLTIEDNGGYYLAVDNREMYDGINAIEVKSLNSSAKLQVAAKGICIKTTGDIYLSNDFVGGSSNNYGAMADGNINLRGNISMSSPGYGFYAQGSVRINGQVHVTGAKDNHQGIYAMGNVQIDNGLQQISGGIMAENGSFIITKGTLIADADKQQPGIQARQTIELNGNVTAIGTFGVLSKEGDITSNGTLTATGKTVAAVRAEKGNVTLRGTVNLTGKLNGASAKKDLIVNADLTGKTTDWLNEYFQEESKSVLYGQNVTIEDGNVELKSEKSWGIFAMKEVSLYGNIKIYAEASNGCAVMSGETLYVKGGNILLKARRHGTGSLLDEARYRVGDEQAISVGAIKLTPPMAITWPEHASIKVTPATSSNPYSRATVIDEDDEYYWLSGARHVEFAAPQLSGDVSIQSAAVIPPGTTLGYKLSGMVDSLYKAGVEINAEWQKSSNLQDWTALEGDSNNGYTTTTADLGQFIRVHVSSPSYNGSLVSLVREVQKNKCTASVTPPTLTTEGTQVVVTNASGLQEYIILTEKKDVTKLSSSDWASAKTKTDVSTTNLQMGGTAYAMNYVYTRVKETETTLAGTDVAMEAIYLGSTTELQSIKLVPYHLTIRINKQTGAITYGRSALTVERDDYYYVDLNEKLVLYINTYPSDAAFDGILGWMWTQQASNTFGGERGEFYADAACTQKLVSNERYKRVYYKPMVTGTYYVAARTGGTNDTNDECFLIVGEDGVYPLGNMNNEYIRVNKGETAEGTGLRYTPYHASLANLNIRPLEGYGDYGDGTAVPVVTLIEDNSNFSVNAENANAGIYRYNIYDGELKTCYIDVWVTESSVEEMAIMPENISGVEGDTIQLSVAFTPSNASVPVTWSSSNTDVAKVDENGQLVFTGKKNVGEATTITATTADGKTATATATVAGDVYDLWIAGVQVTSANKDELIEIVAEKDDEAMEYFLDKGGSIKFDGFDLTLRDAMVPAVTDWGIASKIDGMTINLEGENMVNGKTMGLELGKATTITGDGSLTAKGEMKGIDFVSNTEGDALTIKNTTVTAIGSLGICAYSNKSHVLNIENSSVVADADQYGIYNWTGGINLSGCDVVVPSAYILTNGSVYDQNSDEMVSYVKIEPSADNSHLKGDVNEDKKVDISDIVAVINQIAGTATYRYADVNEDKKVDISDIVAIINIIAGQ